jgi:hypothetical protein
MRNTAGMFDDKPIAVSSQSITGVSAILRLIAFYDILGRKAELYFCFWYL